IPTASHVSTFVIYLPTTSNPEGQAQYQGAASTLIEDFTTLKKEIGSQGPNHTNVLVRSPDRAVAWVEAHYDQPLLKSIGSRAGVAGPLAAMLSPDEPALVVFGSILDGWVLKAAKLLSDVSGNTPSQDSLIHDTAENDDDDASTSTGVVEESDEEDESDTASMESAITGSGDSMDGYNEDGIFRPRGGAEDPEHYTPWLSPVHNVDFRLNIHPVPDISYRVNIMSKIQFKVQAKYENKDRHGYRPQLVSWTKFNVVPKPSTAFCTDRSYSNTGFLVEGQYISDCMFLECSGFIPPKSMKKTIATNTRQTTTEAALNVGPHPTGTLKFAVNAVKTTTEENQNDRVTPKCVVRYHAGEDFKTVDGTFFDSFDLAYEAAEDPNGKAGMKYPMEVEFSMGINVGNHLKPNDTRFPHTGFLIRNQTHLWIKNDKLKAKGQAIIISTMTHISDIQTIDTLYLIEEQKVELAGDSLMNLAATDRTPVAYPAKMSLSVAAGPVQREPTIFKKIANKLAVKKLTTRKTASQDPEISKLMMHEFVSRGWDATQKAWRMPVYPRLTSTFTPAMEMDIPAWELEVGDTSANISESRGKLRDTATNIVDKHVDFHPTFPSAPIRVPVPADNTIQALAPATSRASSASAITTGGSTILGPSSLSTSATSVTTQAAASSTESIISSK
ncbi:hypothetical protein C8R43DRAFT_978248, partial [Mycena crocata]